ncbi:hypothetical protein LO80_01475 [Candidatus Francisella endociliophora]|uniref:Uncharacterized protein n=1 Tax=Candidatus Francisella endociliophora TaxID=653937 RepID=A0A097EMI7_9GAMM|nr:hypothetical protein [Francisella sp. FSC1006]AIT08775.1 hypothetical protein LO80_01475 [Francisella sp. FSC1006]
MLYKQIHLSTSYISCSKDDLDYALSIDIYIIKDKYQDDIFVELDSIFSYVGITDIDKVVADIKAIKAAKLYTETINNQTKHFIYYKHLNPALAIGHFYIKKLGKDNSSLKDAIGVLFDTVTKTLK